MSRLIELNQDGNFKYQLLVVCDASKLAISNSFVWTIQGSKLVENSQTGEL